MNYFNQVSVSDIIVKTKLVGTFLTLQKHFTKPLEMIGLQAFKIK